MEEQIIAAIFNLYRRMECTPNQMVMIQSLWSICDRLAERNMFNEVMGNLLTNGYLYIEEQNPHMVFISQLGYDTYIV